MACVSNWPFGRSLDRALAWAIEARRGTPGKNITGNGISASLGYRGGNPVSTTEQEKVKALVEGKVSTNTG
jgi:hypothetical protein